MFIYFVPDRANLAVDLLGDLATVRGPPVSNRIISMAPKRGPPGYIEEPGEDPGPKIVPGSDYSI